MNKLDKRKLNKDSIQVKPENDKNDDSIIELAKAMVIAAIIALTIRSVGLEPFNIPSGSMFPTLLIGDYLFVEKYAYGYSKYSFPLAAIDFKGRVLEKQPKRGDVAVFRQPKNTQIDYIKRIIGLPGDKIQVKNGILYINEKAVMRDFRNAERVEGSHNNFLHKKYIETLPNGVQHYIYEISDYDNFDNTPIYNVPKGYYFAMGDNRDSSMDSRSNNVGFVPAENLIGRAWFLFFSIGDIGENCNKTGDLAFVKSLACKVIEYPQAIRYSRIFKTINKI